MTTRGAHPRRRYRAARGISFLEVVFATVVLAMAVATMAASVRAISLQQSRSQHLLACAELANRLIIQYLDDEKSLPPSGLTVAYGQSEYRWRRSVTRVEATLEDSLSRAIEDAVQTREGAQSPDRLRKVAMTVWLSEKSGGASLPDAGAPQVTIVRLVDPLAFYRRPPDSLQNLIQNGADQLLERIYGNDLEER